MLCHQNDEEIVVYLVSQKEHARNLDVVSIILCLEAFGVFVSLASPETWGVLLCVFVGGYKQEPTLLFMANISGDELVRPTHT